eukprot:CAMPEP_0116020044 /NCGR_PEP_ID=MMETSP0321-20121206/9575_1 /TAXON_ID=163516 /ORGANISM="Leptocylindrus danicus var. danicus, Strain B650" /LENGTH=368 /DNA_ID=CAMNT_0003490685 /DNA_START=14 /DNA_END=1120 /DNA_ORIENTATION=-
MRTATAALHVVYAILSCCSQQEFVQAFTASSSRHANAYTFLTNSRTKSQLSASASTKQAENGDVVTLDIQLTPTNFVPDEPLFDTEGTVQFVLGGGGHLPGLHAAVLGKATGEELTECTLDAGYGSINPDNILKVPQSNAPDDTKMKVGMELFLQNGMKVRVTEVDDENETFTIDANPPLAGSAYSANIKVVAVESAEKFETATFALGCFWGGELAYMREPGVVCTKVGYTQGEKVDPTYQEVCSGSTGHTEAIQVVFNPTVVSYKRLCELAVDRLSASGSIYLKNQVGNDRGTQYRHGIYYHDEEQRVIAKEILDGVLPRVGDGVECQTELEAATLFYDAEDYHMQYLLKGGQSAKKGATETIRCYG